jgi:hypothetical protein
MNINKEDLFIACVSIGLIVVGCLCIVVMLACVFSVK